MKSILKNYRRRLVNLSTSNRALLLLRLSKELHIDIQDLDFLNGTSAFTTIQQVVAGKNRVVISPYADSQYAPVTPVSKRLRYIRRRADAIVEERGNQELYLAWPFVRGKFADGTVVRCPLLFFPVKLEVNRNQEWELVQDKQQQPHFNQSFLLAYAHYTNTPVAEALLELDWISMPKDPLTLRTHIYELLKENQLALHVGRKFFADGLKLFQDLKKQELHDAAKPGQLYVEPEAVIGIFPQAASFLLNDFDALLEQDGLTEMEAIFTSGDEEDFTLLGKQAQHTFTTFELDASQEAAIQQVKQGKSVVVQGPPGTGKSQLICNLVSDFTARGKKVLVVSQKRAALDVVHQRLTKKGLGQFAALVHDIHSDRRSVFTQLLHQIEQLEAYKRQNLALNSIQTDRAYLEVCRGINRCTQQLNYFKTALFDSSHCGWSPKELYLLSNLTEPHVQVGDLYKYFTAATVPGFLPKLRQYLERAQLFEQPGFIWKSRYSFKDWGWTEKQQLIKIIQGLPQQYSSLQAKITSQTNYDFSPDRLNEFEDALPVLEKAEMLLHSEGVLTIVQELLNKQSSAKSLSEKVRELEALYLVCPAPDAVIPAEQLAAVQAAITAYEVQQQQFLKKIGWGFSKDKKVLKQALAKYNLALNEHGVARLKDRLMLRQQAEELIIHINSEADNILSLLDLPAVLLEKIEKLKQSLEVSSLLNQLLQSKILHKKFFAEATLPQQLAALGETIEAVREAYKQWQKWLSADQIKQMLEQPDYGAKLTTALGEHFEALVAHDALHATLLEHEREVIALLVAQGEGGSEAGEKRFLNSIYLAWINELEVRAPILRAPCNGELDKLETDLQKLLEEKNKLSQEIVLSKLREQIYTGMEYNRLGNAVTYRRLQVQVSKKRALYPVRKLFTQFQDEVLKLVPCWLASPETVSAIFPLQECFDLVIFDEASQCFAEVGIPAIVRGRQVVVAGDAQQLKPSDLYRARWNPEEEDTEELVAESLLQLCSLYLPQVMLTEHYRSLYPELIEFSNQYFYRNKLELIPDRENVNAKEPAINFVQVQGVWQDNTNPIEAEKAVQLIQELLHRGQLEIGVITFNYKQQMLIQDLLEDASVATGKPVPASVLIKNIENIQGDEKDVIILCMGYAPDEKGKMAMQFGSLNQAGGENRLNVAITRARQKVIVISSMQPEQLQVENALHLGSKLLKAYLQYAQQVSNGHFNYKPKSMPVPVHAALLKTQLQQKNSCLEQELPFADLTGKQQQQYKHVVLTDDDLYYSQVSVRQSHADVPQQLKRRGWPFTKVYSRQYWADKRKVLEKLKALE